MKVEIKVPAMGESVSEATISRIIKASGSLVRRDEEVIELETDKVNQVLYAPKPDSFLYLSKSATPLKSDSSLGLSTPLSKPPQPKLPSPPLRLQSPSKRLHLQDLPLEKWPPMSSQRPKLQSQLHLSRLQLLQGTESG